MSYMSSANVIYHHWSFTWATCPAHCNHIVFTTKIILCDLYNSWNSSLYNILNCNLMEYIPLCLWVIQHFYFYNLNINFTIKHLRRLIISQPPTSLLPVFYNLIQFYIVIFFVNLWDPTGCIYLSCIFNFTLQILYWYPNYGKKWPKHVAIPK